MAEQFVAFLASRMDDSRPGLAGLRRAIWNLGEELGHRIWVAEHSDKTLDALPPDQVQIKCLELVRGIPEFICVVDGSYGRPWNLAQLCVLELEIFTAALADKPFHFFLLHPYEADPRSETLLTAVRLARPDLGEPKPMPPETIVRELRSRFERKWLATAPARHAQARRDLDVQFFDGHFTPLTQDEPSEAVIRELLSDAEGKTDESSRLVSTWMAIRLLCSVPYSDPRCARFLPLWDAALSRWASAAAWYGLHGPMPLSRLAAVNTLIWIRERMRAPEDGVWSIQGTYGARASELYSMAKLATSRAQRRTLLRRALEDVNRAIDAGQPDPSGLHAIRGSVLHALGCRWSSIREYRRVLEIRTANGEGPGRIGEAQSELGMGYLRVLRFRKGGRLLEEGARNLERSDRWEFTVRALRKLAAYYLATLRYRKAVATLRRARNLAMKHEMKGQLSQILPLLGLLEKLRILLT